MLYIFDWDGTLSDSTQKIVSCMTQALKQEGIHAVGGDAIRHIIGLGLPEAMQHLLPDFSEEVRDAVRQQYVHHFVASDHLPTPFFPGVEKTLTALKEAGHSMAVATGKSRRGLNRALNNQGYEGFFHATRCADETKSKPDPLMLVELLEEFDARPHEAVMVGDTEFDMAMAKRAGVHRVAVDYGAHSVEQLEKHDLSLCMSDFSELLNWVP